MGGRPRRSSSSIERMIQLLLALALALLLLLLLMCVVCNSAAAEATKEEQVVMASSSSSEGGDDDGWIPIPLACRPVFEYFPNCLGFLVGSPQYSTPSERCCDDVGKLNMVAKQDSRVGPSVICSCIELMLRDVKLSLNSSRIQHLPNLCNTTLNFPISDTMNCSAI